MSKPSLLARLTGWPMITTKYRAHWRVMIHTHPLTRLWASQTIGECEVEIHTMTDALASGDDAPRTTLSKTRKVRPAILESELRLPKYEGFLLFPDGLPVARIKMTAGHLQSRGAAKQPGFVAGDMKATLWQQIANSPALAQPPAASGDGPV